MTDFYTTIERKPGEPKEVYGPYATYIGAYTKGISALDKGLGKVEVHRGDLVCDFCSEPEVKWRYGAADFGIDEVRWGSVGEWAACDACHALIEKDEREKLAERSMDNFIKFNPEMVADQEMRYMVQQSIKLMHEAFFLARTGKVEKEVRP